jgi:hypothetical protein
MIILLEKYKSCMIYFRKISFKAKHHQLGQEVLAWCTLIMADEKESLILLLTVSLIRYTENSEWFYFTLPGDVKPFDSNQTHFLEN